MDFFSEALLSNKTEKIPDDYDWFVPLGESAAYRTEDVADFWDVVGNNTNYYAADPEEIIAENFVDAIFFLDDGYDMFGNPEILQGIVDYLKAD